MRLTKTDREAFVRAVMADVPKVDHVEKMRVLVKNWAVNQLPLPIRAIYENPDLRAYVATEYFGTPNGYSDFVVCGKDRVNWVNTPLKDEIQKIVDAEKLQEDTRDALKEQVSNVIAACTTLKKAQELLPEFVKYLPADRDSNPTAGVPMISTVVADLTKAGWPTGSKNV